jgi:hypothetical protein
MAPDRDWQKTVLEPGNGKDFPEVNDKVTIAYTGWIKDASSTSDFCKGRELATTSSGLSGRLDH